MPLTKYTKWIPSPLDGLSIEELLDELSNQYLLGYQPTNPKRDDTWREIRVQVDGHPNVRARQGYRAAPLK